MVATREGCEEAGRKKGNGNGRRNCPVTPLVVRTRPRYSSARQLLREDRWKCTPRAGGRSWLEERRAAPFPNERGARIGLVILATWRALLGGHVPANSRILQSKGAKLYGLGRVHPLGTPRAPFRSSALGLTRPTLLRSLQTSSTSTRCRARRARARRRRRI